MPVSPTKVSQVIKETPTLVTAYRLAASLVTLAIICVNIMVNIAAKNDSLLMLLPSGAALICFAFFWLVTDFLSDVYRCRRLLEEIAKTIQ